MNRRKFLQRSIIGVAALAAAPAFIRRAFADDSCAPPSRALGALAGAWRRARKDNRPLLVFVVPDDDVARWDRGEAFGEWLNHGTDEQLAPLALVDVACATMADVRRLVPSVGGGQPLMVLIDPTRVPSPARRLEGTLPQYPERGMFRRGGDDNMTWEQMQALEDNLSNQRIDLLARLAGDALVPDGQLPRDAAAMKAEVARRIVKVPPPGANWARSSGCGTIVEGRNDNSVFGCGMGHVPAKSTRFLMFFSKPGVPSEDD